MLLRSVAKTRLVLLVDGLLVSGALLWISSWLVRHLLVDVLLLSWLSVDGSNSWLIGVVNGLIGIRVLLLFLQLEFHFEQLDFLLLVD